MATMGTIIDIIKGQEEYGLARSIQYILGKGKLIAETINKTSTKDPYGLDKDM